MIKSEAVKEKMPTGVFRLKGSHLKDLALKRGIENTHQVALKSGVSYPTIYRYAEKPDEVEALSLRALYGFLVDGIGLTPEEVEEMRFGEVFEAVPERAK